MVVNPNEVIWSYEDHMALMHDLLGTDKQLLSAFSQLMEGMDSLGAYQFDVIDANGQRLVYPVRVVSKTQVIANPSPPEK